MQLYRRSLKRKMPLWRGEARSDPMRSKANLGAACRVDCLLGDLGKLVPGKSSLCPPFGPDGTAFGAGSSRTALKPNRGPKLLG